MPADSLHGADQEHLVKALRQISVLRNDEEPAAAMRGDADAAIGAALTAMPVDKITLPVDVAMTALLGAALNRSSSASLVMAQVIGLTDLPHTFAITLARSWLSYGMRHSPAPDKFAEAAAVLWEAFQRRDAVADEADVHVNEAAWPMAEPIP